jgi:light-regulated signal transduction histidine kinase (bacteriophytochrome)
LVRIWFEDKGIGIEEQYHDKIWELFQQLNKSYEGTGIGLALVRKVVSPPCSMLKTRKATFLSFVLHSRARA